ncbi:glycosyltransferase family 2 protein [bacterium]|nr:glycosyltransferase family 2 protein [bacterium]
MQEESRVDIVLSTYNGAKHLPTQLESILSQSHSNWKLWIRDDGSSDDTTKILEQWSKRDHRIEVLSLLGGENLGPIKSFAALLQHSLEQGAKIISFCDQDDKWTRAKLKRTVDRFKEISGPGLVFSDLIHCDSNLTPLHSSYMQSMAFTPKESANDLKKILCQNFIVGCATSINAELAKLCLPIPDEALMHDWWAALVSLCTGGTNSYISEALVCYRTHPANVSGAGTKRGLNDFLQDRPSLSRSLFGRVHQAHALMSYSRNHHDVIIDFIEHLSKGGILNAFKFHQKGFRFQGNKRQLGALALLSRARNSEQ